MQSELASPMRTKPLKGGAACPQAAFDRSAFRQRLGDKPFHLDRSLTMATTLFRAALTLIGSFMCLGAHCAAAGIPTRPNIVLMMADDQSWGETGYNGHPHVKTPVLDEMARTALRLDRFYAASPVCTP